MSNKEKAPTLVQTFCIIIDYLLARQRKLFWILFICLLFAAIVETGTLGFIAFFASAMSDPDAVLQSNYITAVKEMFHADYLAHKQGLIVALSILLMGLIVFKNALLFSVNYWSIRFATFVDSFFGEKLLGGFIFRYEWHLYEKHCFKMRGK